MNFDSDCVKNFITVVPDFPKPGVSFLDISPLLADPRIMYHVIADMARLISGDVDKIGAFDARGFLFGTPLALRMNRPFFPIRKAGKLPGACEKITYDLEYGTDSIEIQKASIQPGDKVILVDDVLATGGTMLAGISGVEKLGGVVVGCIVLANLAFLPGQERVCEGRRPDFVKAITTYNFLENTGC
jgi:adenine phosphoribosyltransferase